MLGKRLTIGEGLLILGGAVILSVLSAVDLPNLQFGEREDPLLANDPAPNVRFALPSIDARGRRLPSGSLWLIALGSCTGCSLQTFDPARLDQQGSPVGLLVEASSIESLPAAYRKPNGRVWLFLDKGGALHRGLNAFFHPRYYLLDQAGRVVQKTDQAGKVPNELR